jgi:hypothetical protein
MLGAAVVSPVRIVFILMNIDCTGTVTTSHNAALDCLAKWIVDLRAPVTSQCTAIQRKFMCGAAFHTAFAFFYFPIARVHVLFP